MRKYWKQLIMAAALSVGLGLGMSSQAEAAVVQPMDSFAATLTTGQVQTLSVMELDKIQTQDLLTWEQRKRIERERERRRWEARERERRRREAMRRRHRRPPPPPPPRRHRRYAAEIGTVSPVVEMPTQVTVG
ncbi:hypothetical protein SAMN02910356_01108 [Selenomonas sp. GACV-9]|uniref:hypothetical protein n=1 Tax=Selenomonas sp. GACV-9 TaxID=3158782 RepID=UPI0008E57BAA|nr:hypothetical protein SAMN02910356_01108 [Selenomonas ruminantium]